MRLALRLMYLSMNTELLQRAELNAIARTLALDIDCVIGTLMRLLAWYVDAQTLRASVTDIDAQAGRDNFAAALCECAWLTTEGRLRGFLYEEVHRMRHAKHVKAWRKKTIPNAHVNLTCEPSPDAHVNLTCEPAPRVSTLDKPSTEPEGSKAVEAQTQKEEQKKTEAPNREDFEIKKFALPEWVPLETWKEFVRMRRERKRPLTEHAKELCIRRLGRLRAVGHSPTIVLEQSIMQGWLGIFEPKGNYFDIDHRHKPAVLTDTAGIDYQKGATALEDITWLTDKSE